MNLPNKLTIFRIILVPVIVAIYVFPYETLHIDIMQVVIGGVQISLPQIITLLLFIIASFTDFLDGSIARKRNLITSFGKFLDPIADKLLVNTMFVLFAVSNTISVIPVLIMIWRDTLVDGMRMNASSKGVVVAAGWSGKLKTVMQMVTIILLLLNNMPFVWIHIPMDVLCLWIATFISLISGIQYFNQMKHILLESM